jgi:hypothetical protein
MWIVRDPIPGCVHHIIAQFIDRDFLVNDERSRAHYLKLLCRAMSESDWKCFAYAIMSNHIHLAMLAGETPCDRWSRRVHPPFATWLNRRLSRIGPVVAGASAMWVVPREQELRVIAYIHNNPVRAGVVAHARESTWTSHRAYLGEARVPWLAADHVLARLGMTAHELDAAVDADVGYRLDPPTLQRIRRRARQLGALEVGTPVRGDTVAAPLLARRWSYLRPTPLRVLEVTAEVTGVPAEQLVMRGRAMGPRALAVQCGRALGLSVSSVAAALGLSAQGGSKLGLRPLSEDEAAMAKVIVARIDDELARVVAAARPARTG